MSFANQDTKQKFPYSYDHVFEGLIKTMPKAGFKIKNADESIGRISASTGWSLFSYGENVTVTVERVDEEETLVGIESSLKVGVNVAGAHKHAKNFNKMIDALSKHLKAQSSTNG